MYMYLYIVCMCKCHQEERDLYRGGEGVDVYVLSLVVHFED